MKYKIIPKRDEEVKSVRYGCIRFIDSYRFLLSSLDSLVKTLVQNSHETLKHFEEETVDNDEVLSIVEELNLMIQEDRYKNDSIEDLKKNISEELSKLGEALLNYVSENHLKFLKTKFPDKWKDLTK